MSSMTKYENPNNLDANWVSFFTNKTRLCVDFHGQRQSRDLKKSECDDCSQLAIREIGGVLLESIEW